MIAAPQHEIKPAAAVIADDVICQSFIQSSSTLAYACLLIRRRRFELAAHVLHSLEAKQASRFKDMVFYLQAQIGIETGEYDMVKRRLVPRVHQHPNDMVALSLLECCIYHEYAENAPEEGASPADDAYPAAPASAADAPSAPEDVPSALSPFGNAEAAEAAVLAASFEAVVPEAAAAVPASAAAAFAAVEAPVAASRQDRPVPSPAAAFSAREAVSALPAQAVRAEAPSAAPGREPSAGHIAAASGDGDLGVYQSLANDANTQSLALWNAAKGRSKIVSKQPALEPLTALLARDLPGPIQSACAALEGGAVHKICFSFQHLTATTFHAGAETMALVTGPLNQSLLTIVRAENTFRKAAGGAAP